LLRYLHFYLGCFVYLFALVFVLPISFFFYPFFPAVTATNLGWIVKGAACGFGACGCDDSRCTHRTRFQVQRSLGNRQQAVVYRCFAHF
jgi:hypothetical protein